MTDHNWIPLSITYEILEKRTIVEAQCAHCGDIIKDHQNLKLNKRLGGQCKTEETT